VRGGYCCQWVSESALRVGDGSYLLVFLKEETLLPQHKSKGSYCEPNFRASTRFRPGGAVVSAPSTPQSSLAGCKA
jgi:hypothetical protein